MREKIVLQVIEKGEKLRELQAIALAKFIKAVKEDTITQEFEGEEN